MKYLVLIFLTCCIWSCASRRTEVAGLQTTETNMPIPVMGHRFSITGDFNGDGILDTLLERYINKADGKETNKNYVDVDFDSLLFLISKKEKVSFLKANTETIDSLFISDNRQLFGIQFLKNEGDLNGDGNDEIGYVIHWADWSSLNTYHIVSYRNGQWQWVYSFPIHESFLPYNEPEELTTFEGFVKKLDGKNVMVTKWDGIIGDTISEVVELK